jgi:hypothetical protein
MERQYWTSNWFRGLLIGFVASTVVALVALSPLVMKWLSGQRDWHQLADVGQVYGSASAVLTGVGLCGIAVSLLMQWRQNRITQVYSIRQRQFELVKLALDNPRYLYVEGPAVASDPHSELKVYANLLVGHWAMSWDLGVTNEQLLRASAARLFSTSAAREWWTTWGHSYLTSRRRRRFFNILTFECSQAMILASQPTKGTNNEEGASKTRKLEENVNVNRRDIQLQPKASGSCWTQSRGQGRTILLIVAGGFVGALTNCAGQQAFRAAMRLRKREDS